MPADVHNLIATLPLRWTGPVVGECLPEVFATNREGEAVCLAALEAPAVIEAVDPAARGRTGVDPLAAHAARYPQVHFVALLPHGTPPPPEGEVEVLFDDPAGNVRTALGARDGVVVVLDRSAQVAWRSDGDGVHTVADVLDHLTHTRLPATFTRAQALAFIVHGGWRTWLEVLRLLPWVLLSKERTHPHGG